MSDESKLAPERALHLRLAAVPTDEAERALENRFDTYFKSLAPASKSIYLKSWTTFVAHSSRRVGTAKQKSAKGD